MPPPSVRNQVPQAVEIQEVWLEANRYVDMKLLKEHKREQMKEAAPID